MEQQYGASVRQWPRQPAPSCRVSRSTHRRRAGPRPARDETQASAASHRRRHWNSSGARAGYQPVPCATEERTALPVGAGPADRPSRSRSTVDASRGLHEFACLPGTPAASSAPAGHRPLQAFSPAGLPASAGASYPSVYPRSAAHGLPLRRRRTAAAAAAYPPPPVCAPARSLAGRRPAPAASRRRRTRACSLSRTKAAEDRKPVDKRLLAVALVVVVAGGGYFGYTQLSKKSSPARLRHAGGPGRPRRSRPSTTSRPTSPASSCSRLPPPPR